jgi:hypothetical protein
MHFMEAGEDPYYMKLNIVSAFFMMNELFNKSFFLQLASNAVICFMLDKYREGCFASKIISFKS